MGDRVVIWILAGLAIYFLFMQEEKPVQPKTSTTPVTSGTPANTGTTQDTSAVKVAAILALMATNISRDVRDSIESSNSTERN